MILSRVIGFFRDLVLARTAGASAMTDVYMASFTIPDFLNYLMASGALSISFVPILAGYLSRGEEQQGKVVFRSLTTWMGAVIAFLILLAEIFAPQLAPLVAPGFSPEKQEILVSLLRIILPAQFFFYWGGLAISVQQTHGNFLFPALSPLIYNLAIIVFGLGLFPVYGVSGFSWGVLAGSFLGNGLIQFIGIKKLGYSISPLFSLSPETKSALKKYLWLSLPIMMGFSLVVTDEWISKYFASFLEEGALSWLSFARTEMRIPIAIVGQAAGIASFPYLSRLWMGKDFENYARTLVREIEKLFALASVAAIIFITHAEPITYFIYGGGKYSITDVENTSHALRMFGFGIFFWILQVPLSRGFYAAQRTWFPSIVGTLLSLIAIPFYSYMADHYSYGGLALAGSVGVILYSLILSFSLQAHVKKHCPQFSFKPLYLFSGTWGLLLLLLGWIADTLAKLELYHRTRVSALIDVLLVSAVLGLITLFALRKFFVRYTETPLY